MTIAGISAIVIGVILMLILVKIPPHYQVNFVDNFPQLSFNFIIVGLSITVIGLIIVGSIVTLLVCSFKNQILT